MELRSAKWLEAFFIYYVKVHFSGTWERYDEMRWDYASPVIPHQRGTKQVQTMWDAVE